MAQKYIKTKDLIGLAALLVFALDGLNKKKPLTVTLNETFREPIEAGFLLIQKEHRKRQNRRKNKE